MRIAYCTTVRLPTERAHGHQISAVCNALEKLGHEVTIFAPFRNNTLSEDFWTYHGVPRTIALERLGSFDPINNPFFPGVTALWVLTAFFRRLLGRRLIGSSFHIILTRSPSLLSTLLSTGLPVVLELHKLPQWRRTHFVRLCLRCRLIVCLTSVMRTELISWGVPPDRVIVEGDAVDVSFFAKMPSVQVARRQWNIPSDAFVVGYAGSIATMGLSKGVDQLLEAMSILREQKHDVLALIAGGPQSFVADLQQNVRAKNLETAVFLLGQIPHNAIPFVYAASDCLVYVAPSGRHPYFQRDTSPLKIFEYMAAKRAIISADLPPIHDVLDEKTAIFYPPGNVKALADAIREVQVSSQRAQERTGIAYSRVQEHSWEKRMMRILSATGL